MNRIELSTGSDSLRLRTKQGVGEIRYLDDKKAFAAHEASWTRLSNAALRYDETRRFLSRIAKDFQA